MIEDMDKILLSFRYCFSRKAAFEWFIVIVFGLIVRLDQNGVTSFVRCFALEPSHYNNILHFFKADSWNAKIISISWLHTILEFCKPIKIQGFTVILADNIKIPKEATRMPGNKTLKQQSNNTNKPKNIYGQNFGALSLVTRVSNKIFAIPFMVEIQEGVEYLRQFQNKPTPIVEGEEKLTIITLVMNLGITAVKEIGKSVLVLDAFFSVRDAFIMAEACVDAYGNPLLHIITKAKRSYVAYKVETTKDGKIKKGKKYKLKELFISKKNEFKTLEVNTYGKKHTISYLCLDLIWAPINNIIRFVLIIDGDKEFILMSSNIKFSPKQILTAYGYRYKIELDFKYLKYLIGAFYYHFWTKAYLDFEKKKINIDLSKVTDSEKQKLIAKTVDAIEGYVLLGCIALGILQILAFKRPKEIWEQYTGWLRTQPSDIPSEGVVQNVIKSLFFVTPKAFKKSFIYQVIKSKQRGKINLYI